MAVQWKRIKKIVKMVVFGLIGSISAVLMILAVVKVRKAILGRVRSKERMGFTVIPSDPHKIGIIKKDGSVETVQLPNGIKYKNVVAAGIAENNKVIVEVGHEKTDRRNPGPAINNSALDGLRNRVRPSD